MGGLLIGSLGRGEVVAYAAGLKARMRDNSKSSPVLSVCSSLTFASSQPCGWKGIGVGGNVVKINTCITRMLNRGEIEPTREVLMIKCLQRSEQRKRYLEPYSWCSCLDIHDISLPIQSTATSKTTVERLMKFGSSDSHPRSRSRCHDTRSQILLCSCQCTRPRDQGKCHKCQRCLAWLKRDTSVARILLLSSLHIHDLE